VKRASPRSQATLPDSATQDDERVRPSGPVRASGTLSPALSGLERVARAVRPALSRRRREEQPARDFAEQAIWSATEGKLYNDSVVPCFGTLHARSACTDRGEDSRPTRPGISDSSPAWANPSGREPSTRGPGEPNDRLPSYGQGDAWCCAPASEELVRWQRPNPRPLGPLLARCAAWLGSLRWPRCRRASG
jgi:hypothetical protein